MEGETGSGGWSCRGRAEGLVFCLEWLVAVCKIALRGRNHPPARVRGSGRSLVQNRPPGTESPSRLGLGAV